MSAVKLRDMEANGEIKIVGAKDILTERLSFINGFVKSEAGQAEKALPRGSAFLVLDNFKTLCFRALRIRRRYIPWAKWLVFIDGLSGFNSPENRILTN